MSLVDRVKNILLKPAAEWEVIAKEPATVGGLFTGYAVILALIPAIVGLVFTGFLGFGLGGAGAMMAGLGMSFFIATAVATLLVGLLVLWVVSLIVKAISPSFNGNSDMVQATKLIVYSATPTWVAGLISWIPGVNIIASLAAMAYAVYLIYLGVRPVLDVPQEKVAGMTVVTVLIYIVLSFVLTALIVGAVMAALFGGAMMAGGAAAGL